MLFTVIHCLLIEKSTLIKFGYVPVTSIASFRGICVATTYNFNQRNKAGSMRH
jgi:hypothetical protein